MNRVLSVVVLFSLWGAHEPALAESYRSVQERRPDLFHPETGFRISRHRAPTPEDIPGNVVPVSTERAANLIGKGALPIDVSGALISRYDELEGTWLVQGPRDSLPGAVWLPEVGRGVLDEEMDRYLASNVTQLTNGNKDHPVLVFCMADCWMSWNAAQRIESLGYTTVYWFPEGVDGWRDSKREFEKVLPVSLVVE
ncbi:rhodanese domain-containing protein [Roseibium sp. TrichSKD4]|nr:rhodanese domain-containing protein [Roseibium sp. TrichSKD4]